MSGEFTEKAQLFPRVTFREIEDAEFVGEMLLSYAATCASNLSQLEKLVIAGEMAQKLVGKHLHISIYNGDEVTNMSPESLRADAIASLSRCGDMLHAIGLQLQELRKTSAEATTAEDTEYDEKLIKTAADIRRAVGLRKAEEN